MSDYSRLAEDELLESQHLSHGGHDSEIEVERAKVYALLDIAAALRETPDDRYPLLQVVGHG